ncbi:DMT family transporter [Colwellia sp. Bg11-28]|jgi:drug/metabolite transporter (DMT)-like permease|uniref:DMT family transporter n=1 Tax=Colwellia sp. Bg11-28 TaxID=2058305 RepID=UPI000C348608|nr:DMT family transporter [Colwellia sp. Bg11-28]PKH85889.1 EamA family transporter [Colwellia sp. Bg11-28]
MTRLRIILITLLSLSAFAANSLITRFALEKTAIDEASFIMLRVVSGALFLWLFLAIKKDKKIAQGGTWFAAFALFIYAVSFTYGYGLIAAGTGALLLFGSVQITMTVAGYREGERLNVIQLVGFVLAIVGLVILMLPGISAPSFMGAFLMCISGIAWSIYTLQGRGASSPAASTAGNFIKAAPMATLLWLIVYLFTNNTIDLANTGVIYALLSGIVTSGIGYIIWYSVLPELKATQAAIVQLSVPLLVTLAGALLLNEVITLRVIFASITILIGTILVLTFKRRH